MNATELPAVVTDFLTAQEAREAEVALGFLADEATVTDEGKTYQGADEIRGWLVGPASEFTYTSSITSVTMADSHHYDVLHHLEGDFPGGLVDLHYRFTLDGGKISRLVIEP
jgi:hypothetical protein